MAWKIPYVVPRAGDVVDAIELDEMFKPFVEEFSRFNEQNFKATLKTDVDKSDIELGAMCSTKHASVDTGDGTWSGASLASDMFEDTAAPGGWIEGNAFQMDVTDNWQTVPDMMHEITTTGGTVLALANFQFMMQFTELSGAPLPVMQMAFRVDGTLFLEFANGDFDVGDEAPHLQKGQGGWFGASEIEATFPLAPGTHKVEVVVRMPPYGDETTNELARKGYLYSRQHFLMEMR